MEYIKSILCILVFTIMPSLKADMQLLNREMFQDSRLYTSASPGTSFSEVLGELHVRAGGPRLSAGSAVSVDLRGNSLPARGLFRLAAVQQKIFTGAWFRIKDMSGLQVDLVGVCDTQGVMGPTISIKEGKLGTGIIFQSFNSIDLEWRHQWMFLGIAATIDGDKADVRFYCKFPGKPMQIIQSLNNVSPRSANFGQVSLGSWSFATNFQARMGAPSVYSFENNDFSDVEYPADIIEPEAKFVWYCDTVNGDDNADGTSPQRAWKSAAKLREECKYAGIFSAPTYEDGDTLYINTANADLELLGLPLVFSVPGLNVRAAPGQEWIKIKSYKTLDSSGWVHSGVDNVYYTTDTQNYIVLWEDDKFMHHPTGPSFNSVAGALSSTAGSFWTDGIRLYVHPFGSTNPSIDGKRYERSYNFIVYGPVSAGAPNMNIQDIHCGKTCLADPVTNDPIGANCFNFTAPPGRSIIKHCYLYYGSKHNFAIAEGDVGDDVLIDDVRCEQGSPYASPGGQTLYVSFNHKPSDLGVIHRFVRCKSVANTGVIGSSEGMMTQAYPVYYAHNLGAAGEPNQFELVEFIDCDFGAGNIQGGGINRVHIERSTCGATSLQSEVTANECVFYGMNVPIPLPGASIVERNCIHYISGELRRNPVGGELDMQGCTIDARNVTHIQGGVMQASLFTRESALNFKFYNNLVLMPNDVPLANIFSYFKSADTLLMGHNAYKPGTGGIHYQYDDGGGVQDRNLDSWLKMRVDHDSLDATGIVLDGLKPVPGCILLDAGLDMGPAKDHSGKLFAVRNDIGAYEAPPGNFDDWLKENFSQEELVDFSKDCVYIDGDDGFSLFFRYAIGASRFEKVPSFTSNLSTGPEGEQYVEVFYRRSMWARDVSLVWRASKDLVNWNDLTSANDTVVKNDGIAYYMHSSFAVPFGYDRLFYQLEIK